MIGPRLVIATGPTAIPNRPLPRSILGHTHSSGVQEHRPRPATTGVEAGRRGFRRAILDCRDGLNMPVPRTSFPFLIDRTGAMVSTLRGSVWNWKGYVYVTAEEMLQPVRKPRRAGLRRPRPMSRDREDESERTSCPDGRTKKALLPRWRSECRRRTGWSAGRSHL